MQTLQTLKNNNAQFFKVSDFFGDRSYSVNNSKKELTVFMKKDGRTRKAVYKIEGQLNY